MAEMDCGKGGTATSTPVAGDRIGELANQGLQKKRMASTSPEKEESNDIPRCGQKKFAKDNSTDTDGFCTNDMLNKDFGGGDGNVVNTGDHKGNMSQSTFIPPSQQVNAFNTSIFSDDLNSVNNTTHEIFGIKDSLLFDLKALSKKWPQSEKHDVACQSNPLILRPLVKHLFNTSQSLNKSDSQQVDNDNTEVLNSGNNFSFENNLFLRAIATKIDSIADCVGDHSKSIGNLDSTVSQVEKSVEQTKRELSERIEINTQRCHELRVSMGKAYEYTDVKIANLREAIPLALAEVGGDLERRIEMQNNTLLSRVQEEMGKCTIGGSLVGGLEERFREKLSMFETQTNNRLGRLEEQRLNLEIKTNEIKDLKEELVSQRTKIGEMEMRYNAQIKELSRELKEVNNSFRELKAEDKEWEGGRQITKNEWKIQKQRTDEAHERISSMETIVNICSKKTDSVDLIVRKNNIIIDQLSEIEGEEIGPRVCGILGNTMFHEDLNKIRVLRVFRLGIRRPGGPPRKILLELDNPLSRDIVLANAKYITQFGNDGKPFYLNDDVPEEVRRWKNDIQKYIKFMIENKHRIEKSGDDLIINGKRWKTTELNNLPEGQRLMDSRTITHAGKVAFQSSVSPLSNLFPCQIKIEGQTYKSVEHAYQYAKCIHHGLVHKANEIRNQPNAYRAMNLGKEITENLDWQNKRVEVLEKLVKHKEDQVPIFRETLRKTGSNRLIKNSWSHFWGSGCNFRAEVLWDGTYKGQNNFGRILERVRDAT